MQGNAGIIVCQGVFPILPERRHKAFQRRFDLSPREGPFPLAAAFQTADAPPGFVQRGYGPSKCLQEFQGFIRRALIIPGAREIQRSHRRRRACPTNGA